MGVGATAAWNVGWGMILLQVSAARQLNALQLASVSVDALDTGRQIFLVLI